MKKWILSLVCVSISGALFGQMPVHSFILAANGGTLRVTVLDAHTVRVRFAPGTGIADKPSLVVNKRWVPVQVVPVIKGDMVLLNTGAFLVAIDKRTGVITYRRPDGSILLRESAALPREVGASGTPGQSFYAIKQHFDLSADEGIYGLGQPERPAVNWRGTTVDLIQKNRNIAIPFVVSTNDWGLLWDNYSHTQFADDASGMSLWSEAADGIDYCFFYGKGPDGVIAAYRNATGEVPLLPKWTFGYWQSKERYRSQEELLAVAAEYRRRKIPIDNLVQDWEYWGRTGWSSMQFDSSTFPEPDRLMDSLHGVYHIHAIISIWPIVDSSSLLGRALNAKGYLFPVKTWINRGLLYDAYSAEARDIYWRYLNKGILSRGFDGLWMDATEPELKWRDSLHDSKMDIVSLGSNALGPFEKYLNTYPLMTTQGVFDHFRTAYPNKRLVILTRSGFAGQQRTGSVLWSGDIGSSWKMLHRQIAEGISIGFSGMPYWNTDIGGFFATGGGGDSGFPRGLADPRYRELYVRWFQFGAFCPMFRSHGTGVPREMWRFGEPGSTEYEALLAADELRYRLYPYIYSTAWKVTHAGYTMMRGLAFDFPGDRSARNIADQYLFGPAFLVKPVVASQADGGPTTLSIYLPAGARWYDFRTGERLNGGGTVVRDAPLQVLPLFVKAGSILPLARVKQYVDASPDTVLELRVYSGADGGFTLYEDDDSTMAYTKGEYSLIPFSWNDQTSELTIGNRLGTYPRMVGNRWFRIVLVSGGRGVGLPECVDPDKVVRYEGKQVRIRLTASK